MLFQQTKRLLRFRRQPRCQLFCVPLDLPLRHHGTRPSFPSQLPARRNRRYVQKVLCLDCAEPFAEQNRFWRRGIHTALRVCVPIGRIFVAHHEVTQHRGQEACADRIAPQNDDHRIGKRHQGRIEPLRDGFVVLLSSAAQETALDAAEHYYLDRGLLLHPVQDRQQLGNDILCCFAADQCCELDGEYALTAIEQSDKRNSRSRAPLDRQSKSSA